MKQLVEKHPLAIRWFHWLNFPLLSLMIWSGLWIYWANDVYRLGLGNTTLFKFFPQSFYQAFHLDHKLAQGMAWHFVLMWGFTLNGILYVLYTALSGEWRYLLPDRHSFREAGLVVLHDLGLRKTAPPVRKYNGAQRLSYTAIVVMGMGAVFTGFAIYKPVSLGWLTRLLGGYAAARTEHFVLMVGFVLFFVVHVWQVIRAGWNNFRSMVAGFEIEDVPPSAGAATLAQREPDAKP